MEFRREQRANGEKVTVLPVRPALVYRQDATPPFDAFGELRKDRDFARALDHKRTDLSDQSTESYDLELARLALAAGWSDQQVVDLVIYHRAQQIESLRFGSSYYTDLLARARSAQAPEGADAADKSDLIGALKRALKIEIQKVVKHGGTGGTFELQLADGRKVDLGDAAAVLSQRLVRAAVADATTDVIPAMKAAVWDRVAAAIFKAAGPAPIEEAPEQDEARWYVSSYFAHCPIIDIDERDRAALTKTIREAQEGGRTTPLKNQDGRLMIHLGGLLYHIRLQHGVLLSFREVAKRLRKLGFTRRDLEGKDDARGKCRINVWVAPREWARG
jgi:hypothetical protein